jgi:hypothetical protein
VLPCPNNRPASLSELSGGVNVACPVVVDLRPPPGPVRLGKHEVRRAAMPKTSVDKHGYAGAGEHEISPATETGHWRSVHSIAEPPPVYSTAHS